MTARELFEEIPFKSHKNDLNVGVEDIAIDSRSVKKHSLFIAMIGTNVDGHQFVDIAIKNGAHVIVCQQYPEEIKENITYIRVEDTNKTAGYLAHTFFEKPSKHLKLIGVTGTNGKTTIAHLLYHTLSKMHQKTGLLSTIDYRIGDETYPASHTTPDLVTLNRFLKKMVDEGCDYVCMEVSSHAIDQGRINGLEFDIAIYTNLSHDHLDYHKTFKAYRDTKKKWFDHLSKHSTAIINADDRQGEYMVQNTSANVTYYSTRKLVPYRIKPLENGIQGLHLRVNDVEMISPLRGLFNAYNLGAVYATVVELGFEQHELLQALSAVQPVKGRFEIVSDAENTTWGIVDYAHTPDALERILNNILEIKSKKSKVITVVGCGGDRDALKRPKMAQIAKRLSDITIFTSDNPRSEDPWTIIEDMMAGLHEEDRDDVYNLVDREQAIRLAAKMAKKGDVILVAGKGHEDYQEIKGNRIPFDDVAILKKAIQTYRRA